MLTRKQLSLIHVAKSQIDLSDTDYRTILKSNFRVSSIKNLTFFQFKKLMYPIKKVRIYKLP